MAKRDRFNVEIYDKADSGEQFHQQVLLLFVLEGSLEVKVENKISHLKAEDLLVVNANKTYVSRAADNVLYLVFSIDFSVVSEVFQTGDVIFWCDSTVSENERYEDLRILVRRMLNHYIESGRKQDSFGYLSDCYAILNQLTANFMIRTGEITGGEEHDRYGERLNQINNYIYANYNQAISMRDLSEKLYLSNGYLSRFFKKNYGVSFVTYLTNVRVYHAADDLLYTEAPVTRIAYNNGFTSAAMFNKAFKKAYGITPSEFRKRALPKKMEKENPEHEKQITRRLEKVLNGHADPGESSQRVNVTAGEFSVEEQTPLVPYWGKIINFGSAANLLHSSVREHLLILKEALGFEYVRFWNLFSRELYIDPAQETYNFAQIDSILDFILEQGMKPFIELGMKPNLIHYEIGRMSGDGDQAGQMDEITLEMWTRMVEAFLRHLSNRYGQDILDGWQMELWYDEDWRRNPEKYNSRYIEMFCETYRLIKSCNDRIAFGGYSIRMDAGMERRRNFLLELNQAACRPDFISIMYYGYERGGDELDRFAKQTTDNDALLHMLSREKKLVEECGFGDVPLYLNEWNLTPSVRNYINDTTFKGAYIVKNVIDVYGLIDAMGYGAGSDRTYAFYDTSEILFGGAGLLTNDGIMKPAAFAFDFLNHRLFPYYLGKTRNYLVTTDLHDNYAIICHNQQRLNYNYYLTPETALERDSMWKYYEGRSRLNIRVRISGASDGEYSIKIYRINDQNGSVLRIWQELDFEKEPSRNDIKYFRRACEPNLTISTTEAIGGVLMIEEQMQPNEIAVIRVHKTR